MRGGPSSGNVVRLEAAIEDAVELLVEVFDLKPFHGQRLAGMLVSFGKINAFLVGTLAAFEVGRHHASELDKRVVPDLHSGAVKALDRLIHALQGYVAFGRGSSHFVFL